MRNRPPRHVLLLAALAAMAPVAATAESATGLKLGDRVPPFPVSAITGPHAGNPLIYTAALKDAPMLIVFVKALDAASIQVLAKADELARASAGAGLKGFAVCLAGKDTSPQLRDLAKKHKWVLPLTVTQGGANDPAAKLCKLDPKAKNTVIVAAKHQVVYARQDLVPADFTAVAKAVEQAVASK